MVRKSRSSHSWIAFHLLVLLLLSLLMTSCAKSRFKKTYPVHGKVLFDGKTPEGARVVLRPIGEAETRVIFPQAVVGADGSFTVSTYNADDGAPADEYAVTITWLLGQGPVNRLPARYADAETSGLRVNVEARDNQLEPFQLTP